MNSLWKRNELLGLIKYFDKIIVVPFTSKDYKLEDQLPENITVVPPIIVNDKTSQKLKLVSILHSKYVFPFLREFLKKKVFLRRTHFLDWLEYSYNVVRLLKNREIISLVSNSDSNTILYFFWGRGIADILPFIKSSGFKKVFVRFHGYDLYEFRCNNYIPYRKRLLNSISVAAPCSNNGKEYLQALYPKTKAEIKVYRLGIKNERKISRFSTDNKFRIVSCSSLIPLKRVDLMIESLCYIDFDIEWVHLGDGHQRESLQKLIRDYNLNKIFIIKGFIKPENILDYYSNNFVDLFVNVSNTEGVPISIMEALSAGIPVLATSVGGTSEIVDEEVGYLVPVSIEPKELAKNITQYRNITIEIKQRMKYNAHQRYLNKCDMKKLTEKLAFDLLS